MILFLDMDGVISDFDLAVRKHFGLKQTPEEETKWTGICECFARQTGKPLNKLWEALDEDFWATLPKTSEADDILEFLAPYKPIILTAPTWDGAGGKQRWIRKHLPDYFFEGRYLIGPAKHVCARGDALLIDDAEHNTDRFHAGGGSGLLVPRPWNSARGMDVIETVKDGVLLFEALYNASTKIQWYN